MTRQARRTIQFDDNQMATVKAYREVVADEFGVAVSLADAICVAIGYAMSIKAKKRAKKKSTSRERP